MSVPSGTTSTDAAKTFAPVPTSAREARRWVAPLLDEWELDGRADDVQLVVSELVTNAVVHGAGPVRVRLVNLGGGVRVEVTDEGGGQVAPRRPSPQSPGGRGLLVVAHLARRWGVERREAPGKTVWAEIGDLPGDPPTAGRA